MTTLQQRTWSPSRTGMIAELWRRMADAVRTRYAAAKPDADDQQLPSSLRYDAGMSDVRPGKPVSCDRQIDGYARSVAAMLSRNI